jgi:hypothetical protein
MVEVVPSEWSEYVARLSVRPENNPTVFSEFFQDIDKICVSEESKILLHIWGSESDTYHQEVSGAKTVTHLSRFLQVCVGPTSMRY